MSVDSDPFSRFCDFGGGGLTIQSQNILYPYAIHKNKLMQKPTLDLLLPGYKINRYQLFLI